VPVARILVVGADEPTRERYLTELNAAGLPAEGRSGHLESEQGAEVVLVAGGYPGSRRDRSGALMDAVAEARKIVGPAGVLACVPREDRADAIEGCIASGADDVVICPPTQGALLARVRANLRMVADRITLHRVQGYGAALVKIGGSFETPIDGPEGIAEMISHMVEALGWTRAILVLLGDEPVDLTLCAATDEPSLVRLPLLSERYPEIRACIEARQPVFVDDTASSALLGPWAELAATHGGAALLAVPLLVDRTAVGAVLLRSATPKPPLDEQGLDFVRLATQLFGLVLQSTRLLESLRAQTRRFSKERFETERRNRALEQYRDFFESSSDGMVVVDASGMVLYVNRAAEQMTGYAREGLAGRKFTELVAEPHREAVLKVAKEVAGGANLEWFDSQLSTTSGEAITVSVASSSVLCEHGAAILSFRDVTEARALEAELRKTKDFLERLIDSTVDGIIASDLRGNIIIFNSGAAQLYGYGPEEVIGKVPVWKLYADGVAKSIMGELRAGGGRLLPSRRDIVTKEGELIPVQLTASIVYEDGREVASVGIISDLRPRLKIEERLRAAQEKLIVTEKQALIAELAGTTAHELNQPLTSVMGYAELLRKKMQPDDANFRAVDIILREAERMAEIVRKIGRITRYETKAYVGSTQILDLDKASNDPPPTENGPPHD
jgi:PAS domain S-box-containing protein